ncbi:MAG: DedA family protein [Planctomycetes bacterium]|nr:DedA family protein [Planctomycetota bacterium]
MSEANQTQEPALAAPDKPVVAKRSFIKAPVRWMRGLYDWVMSWADKPGGTVALGGIAFAESSFFPIPPDPLMVAMCLANNKRSMYLATVTTVCSVLGGIAGWLLGMYLFQEVVDWVLALTGSQANWYGTPESLALVEHAGKTAIENQGMTLYPDGMLYSAKELFDEYGMWALFIAALTPIPYKVATVASGFFSLGFVPVLVGSVAGRGGRFWAMGLLFHFFGEWAKAFIEKYFAVLSIAGVVLAVGGFVAIKYLF